MRNPRFLLLVIFLLALMVRLAGIGAFPPGLWFDEGLNGVDAWQTWHGAGPRLVYPDVFPREPLLVWLLSFALAVTGPKVLAMRLVTVLLSALACVFFYAFLRRIEPERRALLPLVAAFCLATLHWHAWFGRLVFRTNLVPLLSCAALWALAWAAQNESKRTKWKFAAAGTLVGLGFYTYLSWYFFLPVLALWFWALKPERWKNALLYWLSGAALIFLPLMIHYLFHPGDLAGRPQAISPFSEGWLPGLRLIGKNAADVIRMFFWRGDHVPLHNVALPMPPGDPLFGKTGSPVWDPVGAVLFFAGVGCCFWRGRAQGREARMALAWLGWLGCMSLPSIFSQTDSANTLRNLGATPAVAWLAARGWLLLWQGALRYFPAPPARRIAKAFFLLVLLWITGWQVHKLWLRHPAVPGITRSFNQMHMEIADFCRPSPSGARIFIPPAFYNKTLEFLTIGREDVAVYNPETAFRRSSPGQDHRILCSIVLQEPSTRDLRERFPEGGVEERILYQQDQPFLWFYRIPASALLP